MNCQVVLAREGDYRLSNKGEEDRAERARGANELNADIFFSVHSNAAETVEANGYEDFIHPDAEEAAWTSSKVTFGVLLGVAFLGLFVAPTLVALFDSTPEVVRIGTEYFRIAVFGYTFLSVQQVLCGGLRGAGNTMEDAGIRVATQWGIQIPSAYYLTSILASSGIWWSVFFSRLFGAVLSIFWFSRGTWKEKVIDDVPVTVHDD